MISELQKRSVMRAFATRMRDVQTRKEVASWQFPPGVAIFPEGRCPYCGAVIRSSSIWHFEQAICYGQWKIRDGRLLKVPINHPHISGDGSMCLGNERAGHEVSAMFLGLCPRDNLRGWDHEQWQDWLYEEFEHSCGDGKKLPRRLKFPEGQVVIHAAGSSDDYYAEEDYDEEDEEGDY